jgi:phage replication-related protein YjqB (UPF0714/DUF867 family)
LGQDKYPNFHWLQRSPEHFRLELADGPGRSEVAIVAIHGGKIEPGTSELVRAVASDEHPFYLFEGLKPSGNRDLHITAARFDDPILDSLLARVRTALSFHGEGSDEEIIYLGGLNQTFGQYIEESAREGGFAISRPMNPALSGLSPFNVCNRPRGQGVQLEISRGLRRQLFVSLEPGAVLAFTPLFDRLVAALRRGIARYLKDTPPPRLP